MAGLGNTIYVTEQQEILRKKDFEALRVMHELEAKFKKERKIIKIKTPFGERIKYIKYGN